MPHIFFAIRCASNCCYHIKYLAFLRNLYPTISSTFITVSNNIFKVIKKQNKEGLYELSVKDLEIQEEKEALKEYGSSSSGASIGDIIGAALKEDKKKNKRNKNTKKGV